MMVCEQIYHWSTFLNSPLCVDIKPKHKTYYTDPQLLGLLVDAYINVG